MQDAFCRIWIATQVIEFTLISTNALVFTGLANFQVVGGLPLPDYGTINGEPTQTATA